MNYLAHGYRFLDRPRFLAGTAVPDWLSVCDRSVRIRRSDFQIAAPSEFHEIWAGVARHLEDDDWFHSNPIFEEISRQIAHTIRAAFPLPVNFRASFLGHVLVELLLDSVLLERDPTLADRYYASLGRVRVDEVVAAVRSLSGRVPTRLSEFIVRFQESQFLRHYLEDDTLEHRLAQVVERAGLASLPPGFATILPEARALVRGQVERLVPVG